MISEAEVRADRAKAAQAAATCAVAVGMGHPSGVIRVAEMFETYIQQGAVAAQRVVDSWGAPDAEPAQPSATQGAVASPQEHAAQSDSPTVSRAQELADEAYLVTSRSQLRPVIHQAKKEEIELVEVVIDDVTGSLRGYLESVWAALPEENPSGQTDLRAELGLKS